MTGPVPEFDSFVAGERYDVFTRDGTCYSNAEYLEGAVDEGLWFQYGMARLFIAPHEYDYAEDHEQEA